MAKSITISGTTYQFPEQGTKAGWGEEATDAICAIASRLNTLSGANDIDLTTICINNDQCSALNVGTGACTLSFSNAAVRSFEATYSVIRTDACCSVSSETGIMVGIYDGTAWTFSVEHTGCAGISFDITCAGQVQYYTDSTKGSGTMKFKASTIAQ